MLNILVNSQNLQFDLHKGNVLLDGKPVSADIVKLDTNKYHMILENQSLNIELLDKEENGKTMNILINGKKHAVQIKDRMMHY